MSIIVTLSSSEADADGYVDQVITDSKVTGHRRWKPGTSGPEAAWEKGEPETSPSHLIVSTQLTALEERTWRGPLHNSAYSVRRRLEEMRLNGAAATSNTSLGGSSGIDFQALVPAIRKVEDVLIHGQPAFDVFDYALVEQMPVLIEGETGEGKTFLAEQWSARKGWPVIKLSGNAGASPEKFLGYDIIKDGSVIPQLGLIPQALLRGQCTIIMDELGFFPPEMLTPMYPVLDNSKLLTLEFGGGISIPVPDTVLIVSTNNPGYEGVFADNYALRRRFQIRVTHMLPDDVIRKLIPQKGVRELAVKLRESFRNEQVSQWTPLPTIQEFVKFATRFNVDFACDNLVTLYVEEADRAIAREAIRTLRSNLDADFAPKIEMTPWETSEEGDSPSIKVGEDAADSPFAGL